MDRDQAVAELLSLWGGTYERDRGDACDQAAHQGLQCLVQQDGSLGELRRLNWPAIVTLIDENGAAHFVVIGSLDQSTAHVLANGNRFDLPLAELTYHWFGEHLLLWRPGIPQPKDLTPGMRDTSVLWLRETLARLGGEDPPANPSPLYDSALETRVREFQRAHLLTVDGIVGARTQVAMIADLNVPGTPLLAAGH
jgi:general secretion pathway protein A